jgi:hypothetical protein
MNIDKSEAALALAAIDTAGARSAQLQSYRHFAPFLILWGAIWLLANSVSDLAPARSAAVWLTLSLLGTAASFWLGWRRHAAAAEAGIPRTRLNQSWRWMLCFLVIVAFQVATIAVLPPSDARQQDTFLSMFWTFLYMALGAWTGWRLFVIGLTATVLILFGYYGVHNHYFLYMGCVSGGALMAGGLWLRRL